MDLIPVAISLAPECGAPGVVERVERLVACLQPAAKAFDGCRREALGDMAGIFVVDMPHRQRRVVAISRGQRAGQACHALAIGAAARAVTLARTRIKRDAIARHRQAVRIFCGHPGRRRGGGGGQIDHDAARVQLVHDPIQPAKVKLAFARFEPGPAKDGQRDHVDTGLAHQPDVLVPDRFGPLFRVVIAAVENSIEV